VNEEVVHGIPSAKHVLREGDVISLDIGVRREGWYGDAARTFPVGEVSAEAVRLLETTERALAMGIAQAREGGRISDISAAIEREAKASGFTVVRALVGHGIGRELHEDPQVPNYGRPGEGARLEEGMALAIEPMVNSGGADVVTLADQWTVVTVDRKISAHFEHTVAIGPNGGTVTGQGGLRREWRKKRVSRSRGRSSSPFPTRCSASSWRTDTRCSPTSRARCG
jgi:methionyl aminopeptidase